MAEKEREIASAEGAFEEGSRGGSRRRDGEAVESP
jgi:hypothetical protein